MRNATLVSIAVGVTAAALLGMSSASADEEEWCNYGQPCTFAIPGGEGGEGVEGACGEPAYGIYQFCGCWIQTELGPTGQPNPVDCGFPG
jgi:hypothetical protein